MFTPRSKPSRLTRMKSAAGPWNQVAIMNPSGCQTVANRSQSPASRQTTQFSTSSRISGAVLAHTAGGVRDSRDLARRRDRRAGRLAAEIGGPVGVEGLDRLDPPGLAAGALGLGPHDRLVRRVEDEVGAGRDLDAVAAGLVHVQEHSLRDGVLGRRGLDRDVGVEEQVGGAQQLLARVDEPRQVVQPTAPAGVVGRVDQLVRGDREAHPRALFGAVVVDHLLVGAVARAALRRSGGWRRRRRRAR